LKVLVDTNILISALLWANSKPAIALLHIVTHHTLVLCELNLIEFKDVINRKAPEVLFEAEEFLAELSFELAPMIDQQKSLIRDVKDQPILNAAIASNVDIILTGDKDFLSLSLESPKPMTTAEYCRIFKIG
jgi:putative PIN family toxin of toxin-antitoxin system